MQRKPCPSTLIAVRSVDGAGCLAAEIDFKPPRIYGIVVMVCRSAEGKNSDKTGILQFTAGESLALYF